MPDFDWLSFLNTHHIPYTTSGGSATRGNVAIRCPFCRDDPSEHLAISTEGRGWRCWRNADHKGRNPARLIAVLIGCSLQTAHQIAGTRRSLPGDFASAIQELLGPKDARQAQRSLTLPREFKPFTGSYLERPFKNYLAARGFGNLVRLTKQWGLRYTMRGLFAYRIIFPVYHEGKLVNWTGRTIGSSPLRYKTLSTNEDEAKPGEPLGVGPISDYLLWFDELMDCDCDTIVLCEGPFDALKVSVLGSNNGICATCFFTIAPSETQIGLLHSLLPNFKYRFLMQDQGELVMALRTSGVLRALDVDRLSLPPNVKDPAKLTKPVFDRLMSEHFS